MAHDRGQAAIELALALPLVALGLLAVAQVVVIGRDAVAVQHVAREAARAAAVANGTLADGRRAGMRATALDAARLRIALSETDRLVRADVSYRAPTDVPIVGSFVRDITLEAHAVMQREPSDA